MRPPLACGWLSRSAPPRHDKHPPPGLAVNFNDAAQQEIARQRFSSDHQEGIDGCCGSDGCRAGKVDNMAAQVKQ